MPCRTARLSRLGPPQALWITDDVLAEAWARFARVSNARRDHAARRYGSNVPGPLEAHRRLSKRRMGISAATAGAPPTGLDFGALFGLGAFGRRREYDEWEYRPPDIEKQDQNNAGWSFSVKRKKKDAWESFIQQADDATNNPVEESKVEFQKLLSTKEHLIELEAEHLSDVLAFLQTAADEQAAQNTLRLAQWLALKTHTMDTLRTFLAVVLQKVELQTLTPEEVSAILTTFVVDNNAQLVEESITAILDAAMAGEVLQTICALTTRDLTKSAIIDSNPDQTLSPSIAIWLRCLSQCKYMQGGHSGNAAWHVVYDLLAQRITSFSLLVDHLSQLKDADLAAILLRHWLPQLVSREHPARGFREALEAGRETWDQFQLPRYRSAGDPVTVGCIMEAFQESPRLGQSGRLASNSPLVYLLTTVEFFGVSINRLSWELFPIILNTRTITDAYAVFLQMLVCPMPVHNALVSRMIHHFIDINEIDYAWGVFQRCPYLPLSQCYELPLALVRSGMCKSAYIWTILKRQTKEDEVPMRDRLSRFATLKQGHIDLIHRVAFEYAESPHVRPRVAFRRVWECYLFLKDRAAPIDPIMTRAMVFAGVTRYLKEDRRIATEQFRCILTVVAEVEGKKTAHELNQVAWEIWSNIVLPRIRAREAKESITGGQASFDQSATGVQQVRFQPAEWVNRFRKWLYWTSDYHAATRKGEMPFLTAGPNKGNPTVPARIPRQIVSNPVSLAKVSWKPQGEQEPQELFLDRLLDVSLPGGALETAGANTNNPRTERWENGPELSPDQWEQPLDSPPASSQTSHFDLNVSSRSHHDLVPESTSKYHDSSQHRFENLEHRLGYDTPTSHTPTAGELSAVNYPTTSPPEMSTPDTAETRPHDFTPYSAAREIAKLVTQYPQPRPITPTLSFRENAIPPGEIFPPAEAQDSVKFEPVPTVNPLTDGGIRIRKYTCK